MANIALPGLVPANMRVVPRDVLVEIMPEQFILPGENTAAILPRLRCLPALADRQHSRCQIRGNCAGTLNGRKIALHLVVPDALLAELIEALLRMLREGPDGFRGGLSAGNYATITGASPATATRDLADLTEKGALTRAGERRHARYLLGIPLRVVQPVHIDKNGNLSGE